MCLIKNINAIKGKLEIFNIVAYSFTLMQFVCIKYDPIISHSAVRITAICHTYFDILF